MKTKNLFFIALIAVATTSCMSTISYYQVYKTTPVSNVTIKDNLMQFEDANCKILYDLWDDGGNVGFSFFNKTNTNIYLNMEECFFISNGVANNYYKSRVYTSSSSNGSSNSFGATTSKSMSGINFLNLLQTNYGALSKSVSSISTSGVSLSYNEDKIICIPALTSKIIKEYSINQTPFRDCDLLRYPNKKEIKPVIFTKSNSPIVFSNRIEYKVGYSIPPIKIENDFFVSEITNYPEAEIIESKVDSYCGQKRVKNNYTPMTRYFKNVSPDKFYIKYIKEEGWKH